MCFRLSRVCNYSGQAQSSPCRNMRLSMTACTSTFVLTPRHDLCSEHCVYICACVCVFTSGRLSCQQKLPYKRFYLFILFRFCRAARRMNDYAHAINIVFGPILEFS